MMHLSRTVRFAVAMIAAGASQASAGDVTLTRPARSGVASLLAYERHWDRNCQDAGASVVITGEPSHGTVTVERGTSRIPVSTPRFGSTGLCAGRMIVGNQVMYRSQPGFHGQDHVSWHVVYGGGKSGDTDVTVVVR